MSIHNSDLENHSWEDVEKQMRGDQSTLGESEAGDNTERTDPPPGPPAFPEGGLEAWLVVTGAMIVLGCSFGAVSAFGVYETYYLGHQLSHKTPSDIAWIGSIQLFMMFGSGLAAGSLFDRYGARVCHIHKPPCLKRLADPCTASHCSCIPHLRLFHHDDQSLQKVLSIHISTRHP